MRRSQRSILYGLTAALLAVSLALALYPASATAHYTVEASWQEDYVGASALRSTVLLPEGGLYRLQARQPAEQMEIPLTFDLRRSVNSEAAEIRIQAEIKEPVDCLHIASGTGTVSVPSDGSQISHTVLLIAEPVAAEITALVTVSAACDGETVYGTFQITLLPAGTSPASVEERADSGLFVNSASMDQYTWGKPICVTYSAEHDGIVRYKRDDGTYGAFPRLTAYRIGNGETVTLLEPDTISLKAGENALILSFDRVTELAVDPPEIGLKITLTNGSTESRSIRPTAISAHSDQIGENGIPSVYVAPMDKCGVPEISVERLTVGAAPARTLRYESVTSLTEPEWGAQDAEGGRYLTLAAKDGELPAGSYRMMLTWMRDATVVYQQKCVFYVNYF